MSIFAEEIRRQAAYRSMRKRIDYSNILRDAIVACHALYGAAPPGLLADFDEAYRDAEQIILEYRFEFDTVAPEPKLGGSPPDAQQT
jgi:hypothetical protein